MNTVDLKRHFGITRALKHVDGSPVNRVYVIEMGLAKFGAGLTEEWVPDAAFDFSERLNERERLLRNFILESVP